MDMTDPDVLDPSALEAAQNRMEAAKRQQRDQETDDLKWLMGHKQGRRVMWRLLAMAGIFRNPHDFGQNGLDTAFRCGEQNLGHKLMAEIHGHCPEQYHVMAKEQHDYAKRLERSSG